MDDKADPNVGRSAAASKPPPAGCRPVHGGWINHGANW